MKNILRKIRGGLRRIGMGLKRGWKKVSQAVRKVWRKMMRKLTKWLDPRLEKYRVHKKPVESAVVKMHIPETTAEFIELTRAVSKKVLSDRERDVIAAAMSFSERRVSEVMLPKQQITYVQEDEVLGPLTLDRLYQSGFAHFPVIDGRKEIIGILHTAALNSLEVRDANRAKDIMERKVCYVRDDYTLLQALAAFYRTNCYFFLVIDPFERIEGMLTYQMLVDLLLGETPQDGFERDTDRLAVAKRKN